MKSINIFLLSFVIFHFSNCFAQKDEGSILWGTANISWSDFKGRPNKFGGDEAACASSIEVDGKFINNDSVIYFVKAFMNTNKSWTKTNSDYILEHEKGHFDLTEIYARKIRKELKNTKFNRSNLSRKVSAIYRNLWDELELVQDKYDRETKHSIKTEKQAQWSKKIQEELIEFENYKDVIVKLDVDLK